MATLSMKTDRSLADSVGESEQDIFAYGGKFETGHAHFSSFEIVLSDGEEVQILDPPQTAKRQTRIWARDRFWEYVQCHLTDGLHKASLDPSCVNTFSTYIKWDSGIRELINTYNDARNVLIEWSFTTGQPLAVVTHFCQRMPHTLTRYDVTHFHTLYLRRGKHGSLLSPQKYLQSRQNDVSLYRDALRAV